MAPSQAATDFDSCIVEEASTRHVEFLKRPGLRSLTAEEEENGVVQSHRIPAAISSLSSHELPRCALFSQRITRNKIEFFSFLKRCGICPSMMCMNVHEVAPLENSDEPRLTAPGLSQMTYTPSRRTLSSSPLIPMISKYSSLDWSPELKGDLVQPLQSFSWRWRFQPHIKPVEEDGQDRVQLEVEEAGKSI